MLRAELERLKPGALRRRAKAAGVAEEAVEEACDSENSKAAMIGLILAREEGRQGRAAAATRAELEGFKSSAGNPLGEFATCLIAKQWPMVKAWRLLAQGIKNAELRRKRIQQIAASHNIGDSKADLIDHGGEVISRDAIGTTHQNIATVPRIVAGDLQPPGRETFPL